MDLDLTKHWITRWESKRAVAYDDATGETLSPGKKAIGNPTIAVGLNLLSAASRIAIVGLGLDYANVLSGAISLTNFQIDQLLTGSVNQAIAGARALVPNFMSLTDAQQLVLTDLSFNMGQGKLATFNQFLGFVRRGDWAGAAQDLRGTAWFHQVGSEPHQRGGADVAVLAGADPEEILEAAC